MSKHRKSIANFASSFRDKLRSLDSLMDKYGGELLDLLNDVRQKKEELGLQKRNMGVKQPFKNLFYEIQDLKEHDKKAYQRFQKKYDSIHDRYKGNTLKKMRNAGIDVEGLKGK